MGAPGGDWRHHSVRMPAVFPYFWPCACVIRLHASRIALLASRFARLSSTSFQHRSIACRERSSSDGSSDPVLTLFVIRAYAPITTTSQKSAIFCVDLALSAFDFGGLAGSDPQCLHFSASSLICSAQCGHFRSPASIISSLKHQDFTEQTSPTRTHDLGSKSAGPGSAGMCSPHLGVRRG